MGDPVFFINDKDRKKYLKILVDYFKFYHQKVDTEAALLAEKAFDNLVYGLDLDGEPVPDNIKYFDNTLSIVTKKFYTPSDRDKYRYERGVNKLSKIAHKRAQKVVTITSEDDGTKLSQIKSNLLKEYPVLQRKDLQESVDNYCKLIVQINKLMGGNILANNVAIKNLVSSQIALGKALGIDEEEKSKQASIDDRQSIAALSLQFQETLDKFPTMIDRWKYEELRILLDKYDRQELSRQLFELNSYADMSVEDARHFVKSREAEYESL